MLTVVVHTPGVAQTCEHTSKFCYPETVRPVRSISVDVAVEQVAKDGMLDNIDSYQQTMAYNSSIWVNPTSKKIILFKELHLKLCHPLGSDRQDGYHLMEVSCLLQEIWSSSLRTL